MNVTVQSLLKLTPNANRNLLPELARWISYYSTSYGVTTPARMQAFLAQAAHETAGFKVLQEYASGSAYEGRTDLGNTEKGDGKKFKGRGIFQTTGRSNYKQASNAIFGDNRLLSHPELLELPQYAVLSAFIFWKTRGLNSLADKGDMKAITRKINGGYNGLQDRLNLYEKAKAFILDNSLTSIIVIVALFGIIYYSIK